MNRKFKALLLLGLLGLMVSLSAGLAACSASATTPAISINPTITPSITPVLPKTPTQIQPITPTITPPKILVPIKPLKPIVTLPKLPLLPFKPLTPVDIPPESVTAVYLSASAGSNAVSLQWTVAGSESQVSGYYVVRGTSPGGEDPTPINSETLTGKSFSDTQLAGGTTYYYIVAPLLKDGTWGPLSNEVSAAAPPAASALQIILTAQAGNGGIDLNWDVEGDKSNIDGYYIVKGTTSGGEYPTPINNDAIDETSYSDTQVTGGTTYYYVVAPLLKDGTWGPLSNEASATAGAAASGMEIILRIGETVMTVNGIEQEIDPGRGTSPLIKGGRTLLPIRAVVEALGGTAGWDDSQRKVGIQLEDIIIELKLGSKTITVNGASKTGDIATQSINGRTMVPLRIVADNLGCEVQWDPAASTVVVNYNPGV